MRMRKREGRQQLKKEGGESEQARAKHERIRERRALQVKGHARTHTDIYILFKHSII